MSANEHLPLAPRPVAAPAFLSAGGEMGALMRAYDWSAHTLGRPETWPHALRAAVRLILNTGHPMYVWWGQDLLCFYNDAYRQSIGHERHPCSLGRPAREVWDEIWPIIGPQIQNVMSGGGAIWAENHLVPITRNGVLDEVYWTYSYSPIDDETAPNGIGGVLVVCAETTDEVVAARRLRVERQRQHLMLQQMPGFAALLSGPDHRYDYVNEAYREIAGDRDFIGRTVREVFPDIAGQGFYELLDRVYASGEPFAARAMPLRLDRPDGERFIDFLYQPVRDDAGQVAGLFVGGYDVTDRVRAEKRREALIHLDARLRDLSDPADLSYAASELLGEALGATRVGFGTLDPVAKTITVERNWSAPGFALVAGLHHFQNYGTYIDELLCGVPVANADVGRDPRTADRAASFHALGIRAHLDVPVVEEGRAVAQMFVHSSVPRAWTDEDIAFVRDFAERTRAAIARRTAEQELRESEAELRFALKAGRFGAWTLDLPGGELTTSEICRINFGRPAEAGFTYAELCRAVHPHDKVRMTKAVERSIATGEDYNIEYRIVTPAGDTRWVQIRGQPSYATDGAPLKMTGVSVDVTERRLADEALSETAERLELATENAEIGFWDVDPVKDILTWPPRTKAMFGIAPDAPVTMRDFYEGLHPDDRQATSEAYAAAADPGLRALYDVEYRTVGRQDGRIRWVAAKGRGVFDGTGRCVRVAGTIVDVTARKRAEEQLRDLNETLEARVVQRTAELEAAHEQLRQSQKLEAMGSLTGGVAHDFNNLLTPIVGALDMLQRKGFGGEREQRLIAGAVQSAERAKTLVQRLLAFARRQPLQSVAVDLGQLVTNMAALVSSTTGPQIRVVVEVAPDLPSAKADPNQLEMALLNLAVNARDAMPEGGTLRISASVHAVRVSERAGLKTGRYLCLSVADTGGGMDEATLARAVEPFFSTKGIGKGTGLGLSMVHGLASQLGGALAINSKPGLGTNVELWLPETGDVPDVPVIAPDGESLRGRGTALLVDDEEFVRLSTADMLADLGYRVVETASAEEALDVVGKGERIDLVVTDHLMPGMTGTELAHNVRLRRPDLPVLVVSGYAEVEGITPDLPRLTKPFRKDELAASLAGLASPKAM